MLFDRYRKLKRPVEATNGSTSGKKTSSLSESFFRKLPYAFARPFASKSRGGMSHVAADRDEIMALPRHSTSLPNIRAEMANKRQRCLTSTTRHVPDAALLFRTHKIDKRHSSIHASSTKYASKEPLAPNTTSPATTTTTTQQNRRSYTFGDPALSNFSPLLQDLKLDPAVEVYLSRVHLHDDEPADSFDATMKEAPPLKMPLGRAHSVCVTTPSSSSAKAINSTNATNSANNEHSALLPEQLLPFLGDPHLPLVLIDVRSLMDYQHCRIRGSINVNLPSLLVKRYQRGAVGNFHLENFITTAEGRDQYLMQRQASESTLSSVSLSSSSSSSASSSPQSISAPMTPTTDEPMALETVWVVYDDRMDDFAQSPAWTLLNVLQKVSHEPSKLFFLRGGFQGFLHHLDHVYRQQTDTSAVPDCLEGVDPLSYLTNHVILPQNDNDTAMDAPPTLFLPPTASISTPLTSTPPAPLVTRQSQRRRQANLKISTNFLAQPAAAETTHRAPRLSVHVGGGPFPRRSQSYSAGSKPLQHTSLFSLDTQAARENNANALARRANRRSQQLQMQQQQQQQWQQQQQQLHQNQQNPQSHLQNDELTRLHVATSATGTPALSACASASSSGTCSTWFTASASASSSTDLHLPMDPMVGTPVTATAASFGFTTTTHSPTTMTTKGLGRLMEEDDTISPQTEADFDFTISEVIPGFLYVGPEIETPDQAQQLMARPVKRVLNMAEECHDVALAPFIQANHIAYRKINARDTVEMQNIDHVIMDAVSFIEDAKKQHEGIYVHCKAGKSRSVTVVLAYLVACERWTLKQSYGHVIKARPNMSPNIGFMAELMKLENQVHGRVSSFMETDWSTVHHHPIHASPSSTAASPASLPLPHNHQDWQYSPSSPAPRAALTPSSVL